MILTDTEIVCPSGSPDGSPFVVDLVAIFKSEARQDEVATVTKAKAPELLAEFNRSWRNLDKQVGIVRSEKLKAERALENRRAVLLVQVVGPLLKEKGLTSNDANREALITLDLEAIKLQETFDQIEGVYLYLVGKMRSFENAFSSVKKILGDTSYMSNIRNSNLSGDASDNRKSGEPFFVPPVTHIYDPPPIKGTITQLENQTPPAKMGWGKAKY